MLLSLEDPPFCLDQQRGYLSDNLLQIAFRDRVVSQLLELDLHFTLLLLKPLLLKPQSQLLNNPGLFLDNSVSVLRVLEQPEEFLVKAQSKLQCVFERPERLRWLVELVRS